MRNLRLYNTTGAFQQDELAANNDNLNTVVAVVPGVSRTKDNRKTHFNPKDKEILYYQIKKLNYIAGTTFNATTPYSSLTEVKYFSGTTPEILLNSGMKGESGLTCGTLPEKITIPSIITSSVTFSYVPDKKTLAILKYNITETGVPITLCNTTSSSAYPVKYMEVDGVSINPAPRYYTSGNSGFYGVRYTFDTVGEHVVKAYLSSTAFTYGYFSGLTSLTNVFIPDESELKYITGGLFNDCSNLKYVSLPSTLTSMTNCFMGCTALETVTVRGNNLLNIGANTFNSCYSLSSFRIPESVTQIGNRCFYNCSGLTSISIPNSVTSIGEYSFYSCSSLTTLSIPDSVTGIGSYAFSFNTSLASITFGTGLTSIGSSAFAYDTKLVSITSLATTSPTINNSNTFYLNRNTHGKLYYPQGSGYSTWLNTSYSYRGCPGYWGFTGVEL